MLTALLAIIAEAALGGAVVCAEARGLSDDEQAAIGAVVRERVAQTGRTGLDEMTRPYQFARPCPDELVTPAHVGAYMRGRLGLGPEWADGAVGFYAHRLDDRLRARWEARGWTIAREERGHIYWRGTL